MRYLKKFNEEKDIFLEYILEFTEQGKPQNFSSDRLSRLLRFIKNESIINYTIRGINQSGESKIILKIGK